LSDLKKKIWIFSTDFRHQDALCLQNNKRGMFVRTTCFVP